MAAMLVAADPTAQQYPHVFPSAQAACRYYTCRSLSLVAIQCTGAGGGLVVEHGEEQPMYRHSTLTALRNRCFIHLLERIARKFNQAGVPLMVLKGAALNLALPGSFEQRSMSDLDLLINPETADLARRLLEEMGCLRGAELVREDFFPRFHYEIEYAAQGVYPIKIDLHVRPFRPLRYSRLVPDEAFWQRADDMPVGRATVSIPCPEDMLLHMAVHAAIHGFACAKWLDDLRGWMEHYSTRIDWEKLVSTAAAWRLGLPVLTALRLAAQRVKCPCPPAVLHELAGLRAGWRDRLALWQAPRDGSSPVMHVVVNFLCSPGWRFKMDYLRAVLLPDRAHMSEWYWRRHRGWLPCAHVLRWTWPLVKWVPRLATWFTKLETRPSRIHGMGVFATRDLAAGEVIARCRGQVVESRGTYVGWLEHSGGQERFFEITGRLKYLNHNCNPNAQLLRSTLTAIRPIPAGEEVTISYGDGVCRCHERPSPVIDSIPTSREAAA